jgi:hypothetical protein
MSLIVMFLLLCLVGPGFVFAQAAPPTTEAQLDRAKKETQYTQLEYTRCKSDLLNTWVQGEAAEAKVKALEDQLKQVTDELMAARGKLSEQVQPRN